MLCLIRCGRDAAGLLDGYDVCFDCADLVIEEGLNLHLIVRDRISRENALLLLALTPTRG